MVRLVLEITFRYLSKPSIQASLRQAGLDLLLSFAERLQRVCLTSAGREFPLALAVDDECLAKGCTTDPFPEWSIACPGASNDFSHTFPPSGSGAHFQGVFSGIPLVSCLLLKHTMDVWSKRPRSKSSFTPVRQS